MTSLSDLERAPRAAEAAAKTMRNAASASRSELATRADLCQVALGIVIANAAITFGLIKLL